MKKKLLIISLIMMLAVSFSGLSAFASDESTGQTQAPVSDQVMDQTGQEGTEAGEPAVTGDGTEAGSGSEEAAPADTGSGNAEDNVTAEETKPTQTQQSSAAPKSASSAAVKLPTNRTGWYTASNGQKYYFYAKGKYYKCKRVKIGKYYYCFDTRGRLIVSKVFTIGGKYYYAGTNGVNMARGGWVNLTTGRHYAKANGELYTKTLIKIGNYWYYFGSDSKMVKDAVKSYNGKYFYCTEKGYVKRNSGWVNVGTKKYFAGTNGYLYTNQIITFGSTAYYCKSNGEIAVGSFVYGGVKYTTDENGVINEKVIARKASKGIDVSYWQGSITWSRVKAAGIEFAMLRVGYRGSSDRALHLDSTFNNNIKGARYQGLHVGAYFYSTATTTAQAQAEADACVKWIKASGYDVSMPIAIDMEDSIQANLTTAQRTAIAKAFCERIKAKGYTPMIYASKSWLEGKLTMSQLSGYKVWVAQWNSSCTYKGTYNCWQYSSTGKVNGINGNVDMNWWYSS